MRLRWETAPEGKDKIRTWEHRTPQEMSPGLWLPGERARRPHCEAAGAPRELGC